MMVSRGSQRIRVRVDGPEQAPALMLSNSLGTSLEMWEPQMPALAGRFRVVRYDARGHGGSPVPDRAASIEELGLDALAVMDALDLETVAFCGLSMGGMTGLWLARNHRARIRRLVVANSAPASPPARAWDDRIALVTREGMEAVADAVLARWFTPDFLAGEPATAARLRAMLVANDPAGYASGCAAVRDLDLRAGLGDIHCPTLIIGGSADRATPPEASVAMADAIPGASLVLLDAAHLSNWERPAEFTGALLDFLVRGGTLDEAERHGLGMAMRRRVLGDAWVDHANARSNAFTGEFQNLITRYAWGEIWTRPGLPPATRSCMVLSTMIALGHWQEFRLHVRAAFNNGLGRDGIKEVILQSAIYCGVPAANAAFHHAGEVLAEIDEAGGQEVRGLGPAPETDPPHRRDPPAAAGG